MFVVDGSGSKTGTWRRDKKHGLHVSAPIGNNTFSRFQKISNGCALQFASSCAHRFNYAFVSKQPSKIRLTRWFMCIQAGSTNNCLDSHGSGTGGFRMHCHGIVASRLPHLWGFDKMRLMLKLKFKMWHVVGVLSPQFFSDERHLPGE